MDEVYIRFINGTSIRFRAREFDIHLERTPRRTSPGGSPTRTPTAERPDLPAIGPGGRHNSVSGGGWSATIYARLTLHIGTSVSRCPKNYQLGEKRSLGRILGRSAISMSGRA